MIEDLVTAAGRLLARLFADIVLEILVKGPGYLIIRPFRRTPPDPAGLGALLAGAAFWLILAGTACALWRALGGRPG